MTERVVTRGDCEELTQLWNRSARFDQLSTELLREKLWNDPDFDESLCLALEHSEQLIGFGTAVVRKREEGNVGYIKLIAIDPSYQGRGHGRQLLSVLENRLADERVAAIRPGESAPNYLTPGIDVRYTMAMLMFESSGYQRIGETHNLTATLPDLDLETDARLEALGSLGVELRRFAESDLASLQRLLDAQWPAWTSELAKAKLNSPPSIHLALRDGGVVGFAAYDSNNLNTGWFGPMGTDPDCRGLGIGEVLLKRCLADIRDQGHQTAIIPWVGPIKFYARHTRAQIDRVFHRYEKKIQPV